MEGAALSIPKHCLALTLSHSALLRCPQVLWGDVRQASLSLKAFFSLWRHYGFVPERFDLSNNELAKPVPGNGNEAYALRPELIESAMHLYQATRDPAFLEIGREFTTALLASSKVPCGFATVADVRDHKVICVFRMYRYMSRESAPHTI